MILQDLNEGEEITLEIFWGDNHYEIPTTIVGKNSGGTMINPFNYNGTLLELNSARYRDMIFNVYYIEPYSNTRIAWKNVTVETIIYQHNTFYIVRANNFRMLALDSERRARRRMPLLANGMVYTRSNGARIPVHMNDISDGGLSFRVQKNLVDSIDGPITVLFEDTIRGHHFNLSISCRPVHK